MPPGARARRSKRKANRGDMSSKNDLDAGKASKKRGIDFYHPKCCTAGAPGRRASTALRCSAAAAALLAFTLSRGRSFRVSSCGANDKFGEWSKMDGWSKRQQSVQHRNGNTCCSRVCAFFGEMVPWREKRSASPLAGPPTSGPIVHRIGLRSWETTLHHRHGRYHALLQQRLPHLRPPGRLVQLGPPLRLVGR